MTNVGQNMDLIEGFCAADREELSTVARTISAKTVNTRPRNGSESCCGNGNSWVGYPTCGVWIWKLEGRKIGWFTEAVGGVAVNAKSGLQAIFWEAKEDSARAVHRDVRTIV